MSGRPDSYVERYGPWAVVTGASDGIGREFARALAARGMHVVITARRADRLDTLATELRTTHGIECRVVAADLATPEGRARVIDATADIDVGVCVAAAGFGSSGAFLFNALHDERDMLAVNCLSLLEQSWHFGRRFAARGRGALILVSSIFAFQGVPRSTHYAATKAYVQSLAEGLHAELTPLGVDVLAAAPGPVATGFAMRANLQMARATSPDVVARETLDALGRRATVRPGWLSKVLGWSLGMAPRPIRVRILGRVLVGMTAHQRGESPAAP